MYLTATLNVFVFWTLVSCNRYILYHTAPAQYISSNIIMIRRSSSKPKICCCVLFLRRLCCRIKKVLQRGEDFLMLSKNQLVRYHCWASYPILIRSRQSPDRILFSLLSPGRSKDNYGPKILSANRYTTHCPGIPTSYCETVNFIFSPEIMSYYCDLIA